MRGAEAVIRALEKEGVQYIAGFSGGGLNPCGSRYGPQIPSKSLRPVTSGSGWKLLTAMPALRRA